MNKLRLVLLCSLALAVLPGCGLKGPLYLPEGETSAAPAEPELAEPEMTEEKKDGA